VKQYNKLLIKIEVNRYADFIGCPAKSSYDSPAVLYNLFDVFAKVSNIKPHKGYYYTNIEGRFLRFLGNEL